MTRTWFRLAGVWTGVALLGAGPARAESNLAAAVELRFQNIATDQQGLRELRVTAAFPERYELIIRGKLVKAIAEDGTDLLPEKEAKRELVRHAEKLSPVRGKMRNTVTIPLRTFDSQRIHALREIAGTFTCLVGEWKETDLGLTGFGVGQRGTQHGAKIESIQPWGLPGGTETLALFLNVPLKASDKFVLKDGAGQPLDARRIQQETAPGGSISRFLLKTGKFPETGKILAQILTAQPVEVPFALTNFNLAVADK